MKNARMSTIGIKKKAWFTRDLRRAFKALAMKYQIPTQFLRQQTIDGREKDDPSKVAWNFFTAYILKPAVFRGAQLD
jgi:hypothetical protein